MSSRVAGDGRVAWRGSSRLRLFLDPSGHPNGREASLAVPNRAISSAAAAAGVGAVVARRRLANRRRHPGKASQHGRPVRHHLDASPAHPGRSGAGIGARILRAETRRRPRRPARHPIRIGAVAGVGGGGVAVPDPAVRRVRAAVRALARDQAEISKTAEFAGIEWTSGALA